LVKYSLFTAGKYCHKGIEITNGEEFSKQICKYDEKLRGDWKQQ